MRLTALEAAVREHTGELLCERIKGSGEVKTVGFRNEVAPPVAVGALPEIGRLTDFYDTFESVVFYYDERSGDAGIHIASPSDWDALSEELGEWFASLDAQERAEIVPDWARDCLVIGEEPHTGNYILMPTSGDLTGHLVLFDHDGFEFSELAENLIEFVERLLAPDDRLASMMPSHMRFIDGDPMIQMVDSRAARQPWKRRAHQRVTRAAT